jgi:hypothetical protein
VAALLGAARGDAVKVRSEAVWLDVGKTREPDRTQPHVPLTQTGVQTRVTTMARTTVHSDVQPDARSRGRAM